MSPSTPFVDPETGTLDTDQILVEAIPLAKLIGLVAVAGLVPLAVAVAFGIFELVFMILAQFVFAVGSAIVLMYVVCRGIQLAES